MEMLIILSLIILYLMRIEHFLHLHKYGKVKGGYQYCKICGKAKKIDKYKKFIDIDIQRKAK